ncbi:MAG: uL15 family ribosomal protein [Candidatus Brennerbacteria bacterium]|nr:uL15 family ribosomal protein [Candidatus Brennerbacteria bacterium]
MQLHELYPIHKIKKNKRIARGGKRGTYSGRGIKGQKSRSGHVIKPQERDLIIRIPKLRGFRNKSLRGKPIIVNIGELEKKKDFLNSLPKKTRIKILGRGEIKNPVEIAKNWEISKSAKEKLKVHV